MDWFTPIDIYCERLGPDFWAEPLNAFSNLAFILAALWGASEAHKRKPHHPSVWLLIVLAFGIGIGSFLFHTFATHWSEFADTIPIWTFVAVYVLTCMALIGGTPPGRLAIFIVVGVGIFIIVTLANSNPDMALAAPQEAGRFNGSEQYLPALIAMLVFSGITFLRGHQIRLWAVAATVTFLVSLLLRTVDLAVCDMWPYGTHFFWHLLNAAMIALLLQGLIRNTGLAR